MKTYSHYSAFSTTKNTIATLGIFDGMHLGHQKIIKKLVLDAQKNNSESVVLTFFPHPKMFLQKESFNLINTIEERKEQLQKLGVNHLIVQPFDKDFSDMEAEDFVQNVLVNTLKIQKIIIGYDHRFGKNRSASISDLIAFGKKFNFEVEQIPAQEVNDIAISSTKIRQAISNGNISEANKYLGYNYFFSGIVEKGNQLGNTIGFPTANIKIAETYKLLPKNGVYLVKSGIDTNTYFGLMNIGFRPTVDGENHKIEVHFLNFNKDIYHKNITIQVVEFIRNEQKFGSLDLLKNQIEADKQYAISKINSNYYNQI